MPRVFGIFSTDNFFQIKKVLCFRFYTADKKYLTIARENFIEQRTEFYLKRENDTGRKAPKKNNPK